MITDKIILQHRAGVRSYTSLKNLAKSCVFIKQSFPPILLHLLINAYKGTLSSNVTESFCRVPSLLFSQHLNILYQSTCVGFKYGNYKKLFLEKYNKVKLILKITPNNIFILLKIIMLLKI